ncbi:pyruvate dehydrogenase E2 component (dihydrolipoamide acetyltransferase) [Sinorhizobium fredii]|uniref:Dihydrolipoyllysine-residue acetyltransferase component of acetoin cleaving system n=1 Tax=Sinorhizobium fredii (strain USDA 257) TaxID=1185652 RepID=I3X3D5_SINF2|nr:acetoin dehydrogenase dihydrolipoyllysine-residue acetyltransferase subunit [Sinorhizobium fredii]AFL50391.1 dihydrolipoyllysine-residue acetyltransferase component of acetoin cleaving system [Sinorhizobium fredii USDA 257]AFL50401.1 dihydrolipoyllysine-residue acetyltransferase component of acetoin cleaving system [Sinorhizobium fredii USDA 257]
MSSIEAVTVPKWGMTMTEGKITQWMVGEGEHVTRGQEILEIETTKVTNVVEAAATGTLRRIVLKEGTTAPVGALAGVIAEAAATSEEIDAFIASYADRLGAGDEGDGGVPVPRTIAVDGGAVNVLEAGPQGDETVVLLHGFGGDLSTWLFNQSALAENMRVVAIDLPGHGASSPIAGGDVFPKIVSAVEAAVEAVAPGKLHLIAHSFGGAVAAAIAANRPSRVGSLTLIAPIGLSRQISRDFLVDFVAAERRRPLLGVLERLFADPSKITSDMVEGTLRFKRLEGVPEALSAIADTIADDNGQLQSIGDQLQALTCPVTLIWGERDGIVPVPQQAEVPGNVQLRIIPGAGHMPQMEASSAVNEAIMENIQRSSGI